MEWLALDIGGANLKLADGLGHAESFPFELWREPNHLTQELRTLIAQAPRCDHLAVTMTGELADCFDSKAAGVAFILDALEQAADGRHTRVYLNDGSLVTLQVAKSRPAFVAAANWHALARFAGRFTIGQPSLLIDVGSTTCDVIPMINGEPITTNRSDTSRLLRGELIYAGVERTPVCALVSELPYREQRCPIARELFATTRDVYTLLDRLSEQPMNHSTADGRATTKAAARARLARMICADSDDFNHRDAILAAEAVADAFMLTILNSIQQVTSAYSFEPTQVILSGHGAFATKTALERTDVPWQQLSLASEIGPVASRCAPAHALAVLAREAAGI
ncbi:MAG: H4MPT-linked C1 transfer pathway protein [Planctomycetes bacterium]|nr:H4MPT-linked C1 transfer pathway protein [Planctomycetota bacterium]